MSVPAPDLLSPALLSSALRLRAGFVDEYPFPSQFLDLGGHRYHYIDCGPTQSGPNPPGPNQPGPNQPGPVLCVHGNPTWSFAWRHLVKDLSPARRVLAVDHLGCGFSDKPTSYPYDLAHHIDNLVRFIEALDLRNISLVVHDWGGAIGFGAAARLPDRFSRFVVCNTAAFRSSHIPFRIAVCRWPIVGTLALRGFNAFSLAAVTMATTRPGGLPPAVRAGYLAPYDSWDHRVAVNRFVKDIPMSPAHPSYQTLVEVENSLSQWADSPMLLAWGLKDWCFNVEFLAEWVRRFPNANTLTFEGAGHYLFEDAHPDLSHHITGFLNRAEQPKT